MRDDAKLKFARHLRSSMTDAEQHLWRHLRRRQLLDCRFRRQHPVGPYIVDFICLEVGLVIELDGGQHNAPGVDAARDRDLAERGYKVLRFWNNDVLTQTDAVLATIHTAIGAARPHPNLPPPAGEGAQGRAT